MSGQSERPTFAELVDWIEGRLTREEASAMAERLDRADDETLRTIDWLRGFQRFARSYALPDVPPIVGQRLRQTFRRHQGEGHPVRSQSAVLSFDSRDDAVLVGVRGGPGVDASYRLAFASDGVGILVDIAPDEAETVQLVGQVLSGEGTAPIWSATVHHPAGTITDITGDADGCFSVGGVPLDSSQLVLSNGELEISIDRPLGESEA